MEEVLNWAIAHWVELSAAIGAGGIGHFGSKKLTDKAQDAKLKRHADELNAFEKRFNDMDKLIVQVQNELAMNSQSDANNRERMEAILADLKEGQRELHKLLMEIVTGKIRVK